MGSSCAWVRSITFSWCLDHCFALKMQMMKDQHQGSVEIYGVGVGGLTTQATPVQSLSRVQLSVTPWATAHQASLFITSSCSLLKLMSIESVMPSNHLILCRPLLLPPSIFPTIRVFSNESVLHIKWPEHWGFSFTSVLPMNIQD